MTTAVVERLRATKTAAWEQAKAIREKAIEEQRELTASEQERWDRANVEIDDANARLTDIFAREARAKIADPYRTGTVGDDGEQPHELRDMIARGESVKDFNIVRPMQRFSITDSADSASLFSSDFSSKIAMYMRTLSPWFALADILRAKDGRPLVVPKITADTTSYSPGEGTAITESTPTVGNTTATVLTYKTLSFVSQEALSDVEFNLEDSIAKSAARSIGLAAGSDFTVGVLAGINNGGTAVGTPFYLFNDVIGLSYGRAAPYRQAAGWVMANAAISKTRRFTDTVGQYLWEPDGIAGQPDALLGAPVFEDPYLAAPASATKSVLYGDFKSALLIKATDLRVEVSSEFKFDLDMVAFKTVLRAGLVVQDPAAAAFLVSANS